MTEKIEEQSSLICDLSFASNDTSLEEIYASLSNSFMLIKNTTNIALKRLESEENINMYIEEIEICLKHINYNMYILNSKKKEIRWKKV